MSKPATVILNRFADPVRAGRARAVRLHGSSTTDSVLPDVDGQPAQDLEPAVLEWIAAGMRETVARQRFDLLLLEPLDLG
jgi:hypothetical protein